MIYPIDFIELINILAHVTGFDFLGVIFEY